VHCSVALSSARKQDGTHGWISINIRPFVQIDLVMDKCLVLPEPDQPCANYQPQDQSSDSSGTFKTFFGAEFTDFLYKSSLQFGKY